jgi:hypothetical protein
MAQPLSRQLLVQARRLARFDPRRPGQANLRRAVSTGYYALFHFLIEETMRFLLGTTAARAGLRNVLARAFTHAEMAAAAKTFAGSSLPPLLSRRLGAPALPPGLRLLARTFLRAQEMRHAADYDPGESFNRNEVLIFIDDIEQTIAGWSAVRTDPAAEFFLLSLLVWNRIRDK